MTAPMAARVARGAARGVAQAAREAAAAGPGGAGAGARPRVLVVAAEGDRGRRSAQLVDAVLQGSGAQVLSFTLPKTVAAGAEPQLDSVLVGLDTLRRTGADVVLAHGNAAVMNVAKAISMLAFELPRSQAEIAAFFTPVLDGRAPRKGSQKPAKVPDLRLPLVALPTLPCAGAEASPVVALADYDKERRLVLSDPALTPAHVLYDPETIALDVTEGEAEARAGVLDARLLHCMAGREIACALEGASTASTDAVATYLTRAAAARESKDVSLLAEILAAESLRMGASLAAPLPLATHEILAASLRDVAPISFENACGSLLGPTLKMLLQDAELDHPIVAEVANLVADTLPGPAGLLSEGVIFDREEHLKPAAQAVDAATRGRLHCDKVLQVYEAAL